MKRLAPTDIITAAHVEAILIDIARFDVSEPATDKPPPLPELSPGFRRVHVEGNGTEREPLDGEPYMIIEQRFGDDGNFETTVMPANNFRAPRFGGPWEITAIS